ncbi:Mbeg1-like protein, partial [uncultured Clostridium sp.]|uniref:Mbeg1-like protein n=1 Tax=uncultured Clostridium sp. TaxID=59620 RepID=UPI0025FEFCE7
MLEGFEKDDSHISGKELADIARYLQSNENISNLVLKDAMYNSDGTPLALCFSNKNKSNEAIVAFKGTTGGEEWSDNVKGLNATDTSSQKEALDFIESLPYIDITTVGHSKGGNKSMYVRITSDKVKRSVSLGGQGFSQEFIDKYWAEIQMKGNGITNYSL